MLSQSDGECFLLAFVSCSIGLSALVVLVGADAPPHPLRVKIAVVISDSVVIFFIINPLY
jgi:hypothetical protein